MHPLVLIVFIWPALLSAEIFKWTDESGQVHYGDRAVGNSQKLDIDDVTKETPIDSLQVRKENRNKLLESFSEERKEKNKKLAESRKKKAKLNTQCNWAKDRLKKYQRAPSLYDLNSKGKRVTLSDKERRSTINKLRSKINRYCR